MGGVTALFVCTAIDCAEGVEDISSRIPDRRFKVRDFGARGDGRENDSRAIEAAINKAHSEGGGIVIFPPGRYPAASVRVRSRVRLELDAEAEIFGASGPVFDLPIERPGDVFQDMGMSYPELSIIWGDGVEDFEIVGGKINGGSITRHDPEPGMGNKVIAFINSRRLRFDSVTHETGGHFVYNLNGCEDATLKDIVIGLPRGRTALKADGNTVQRPVGASPMPVGLKKPNAWGLHDMHGNVWEWCLDPDPTFHARHIIRGGSWRTGRFSLRSANRASLPPDQGMHDLGFRLVLNRTETP